MWLVRRFPSTEISRPLEAGIQYDGYVGWDLTEDNIQKLCQLESEHETVMVEIIESELPTGIWTVNQFLGSEN